MIFGTPILDFVQAGFAFLVEIQLATAPFILAYSLLRLLDKNIAMGSRKGGSRGGVPKISLHLPRPFYYLSDILKATKLFFFF